MDRRARRLEAVTTATTASSFLDYMQQVRSPVEQALRSRLAELLDDFGEDGPGLLPGLCAGKKIRACLLCLVCEVFSGSLAQALPRAVALELIQAASLIHDDFIDQDELRRGLPAIWKQVGPRRAVLLGDLLFASAIHMMSDLGREDVGVLSQAIAQLSLGAAREPLDAGLLGRLIAAGAFEKDFYPKMIRLKTGILFASACRLGALAAGAAPRAREAARDYGMAIGEAYQMADDIHDIETLAGAGAVAAGRLAGIAPALLCFGNGMRAELTALLGSSKQLFPSAAMRRHLRAAGGRMRSAIARRLSTAASGLRRVLPPGARRDLIESAPVELIGLFNAVDSGLARADDGAAAKCAIIHRNLPEAS